LPTIPPFQNKNRVKNQPINGFIFNTPGLHPQAIFELIDLIREQASHSNSIWMTTHSESVVRQLKLNELWLVDKKKGRTQMKSAAAGSLQQADLAPLGVDEAWLSNS
jgi:predicted ATPase